MRKTVLFLILFALAAASSFGQSKTPPKKIQKKVTPTVAPIAQSKLFDAKISDAEWTTLAAALDAEDWDKGAALASQFIKRLKTDDEKKQLARLRYLYLYALAGRVFKISSAPNAGEETVLAVREELVRAAARFTGREFVLPARRYLPDCKNVVNYICAVGAEKKLFRTTATAAGGTEIYSFDYVSFDRAVDLQAFTENKTFLGGVLRRAEFNDDLKQPWVMRLVFDGGFVRVVL